MTTPHLTRASVKVRHAASDGYSSEETFKNVAAGTPPPEPVQPLLDAITELARITALFGFANEALAAFNLGRASVTEPVPQSGHRGRRVLSHRELALLRRAAEDAIEAANPRFGPFIDAVAHPLNFLALVDMAQSGLSCHSKCPHRAQQANALQKL